MKKLALAISFFMISSFSYAQVAVIGIDPLDQSSGAKPMSLGGAFAGESHDVNCLFYNPAGLATSKGMIITAKDIKNFSFGAAYQTGIGNIGVGTVFSNNEKLKLSETVKGNYESDLAFLSYGAGEEWFSVGVTLKTIMSQRLKVTGSPDMVAGTGSDYDAGVLWKPYDFISLGAMLRNGSATEYDLGTTKEVLPRSTRIGMVLYLMGRNSIISSESFGLKVACDSENWELDESSKQNSYSGAELSYNDWLFLRGGSNSIFIIDRNVNGSSAGLGFKFQDNEISIASVHDPLLQGDISYISFSFAPLQFPVFRAPTAESIKSVPETAVTGLPPQKDLLRVDSPIDGDITYKEKIIVSGETRPKAKVLINGAAAYVENDGRFRVVQPLIMGKNLVEIIGRIGPETKTVYRKVFRKAKVVIAEEAQIDNRIALEVTSREAELARKQNAIQKEKENGADVTQKEKLLAVEKVQNERKKENLLAEKKKLEDRKEKVENLVTLGVIEVSPATKFQIEAPITRGEMISWLVKAAGLPVTKVEGPVFVDVPKNHKYAPFILAALDAGLIKAGEDRKFRPDDPVKEEEGKVFFKAFGVVQ